MGAVGDATNVRTIRTAQRSVSPTVVTWKLLRTSTCRAWGNWAVTSAPSAGVVIESSSPLSTRTGTSGYAPPGGNGGPAGLLAGAAGHCVHQSSICQSESAYSRTVNGP